jgi:TRAP-type C4-dicarboxylate transport system permease small subunit
MRARFLDPIYKVSEIIAAGLFFLIFAMILAQVLLSLADRLLAGIGVASFGFSIPSYAEFAGYLMAAACFMGLAGALRAHAHVQVTLLLHSSPERVRNLMEILAGVIATCASAYFLWWVVRMVHQSWVFGDTSYGLVSIPMWIPQSPMVIGLTILTIAFVDFTVAAIAGHAPRSDSDIIIQE